MTQFSFEKEFKAFGRALKNTKFKGITRGKIAKELLVNGVSAIIALLVSNMLSRFFTVKSFRNLWGLAARKKDKMLIDRGTYEWLNVIIIFIVGLFVFSIVEELLNKYLEEREKNLE